MDRRVFGGAAIASLIGLATGRTTEAGKRARRCGGCNGNKKCKRKYVCFGRQCVDPQGICHGTAYNRQACAEQGKFYFCDPEEGGFCCNNQGHGCKPAPAFCAG